jgi:alcohol dehydrogenase class IV
MRFEFATAARIIFGPGTVSQAAPLAREMGQRALVTIGLKADRAAALLAALIAADLSYVTLPVPGEPTVELARAGAQLVQAEGCDLVIGLGGGSAIDAGKAIAALAANGGDPLDYLEVVGRGQPLSRTSLPLIAIPTTAGAGAEVTRNAVLASSQHGVKASLRSPSMLPRLAIVDPELTYSLPPEITASTGLDALTQLIEPFVSSRANPMTDALCREGMMRAARSLRRAYEDGQDVAAREDMALASLFGGLALANAGLGAAHGFAGPVGGMFSAPHGAVCAAFVPHVMAVNVRALAAREPANPALARYDEIARILTGDPRSGAEDGVRWICSLCAALRIPPLSTYGVTRADFPALIEKTAVASSTKANPISLTPGELSEILTLAL